MIRYIQGDRLADHPRLADSMFRDRAAQFRTRLGWKVTVDASGHERDDYDALNPLYAIWETPEGRHGGSMRFLPTTGRTMVNEHFLSLTDGRPIVDPAIWECTRFCLSPGAGPQVSAALMLAGTELLRGFGLSHFVGVFDARMVRVYQRLGGAPVILGMSGTGPDAIGVGLWSHTELSRERLLRRSGISAGESAQWYWQGRANGLDRLTA